jgi:hypothetical protein
MIDGFEKYTIELNDDELKIVHIMVDRFTNKPGIKNIVTNPQIVDGLKTIGIETSEPRIRKIIQYIRTNALIPGLIATSKGYYSTNDIEHLQQWIVTMKQRENAIRESRKSIESYIDHLKNGKHKQNIERNIQQTEFDFQ